MSPVHRQNLGEMLLAANLIDEVQMQIALAEQRQTGRRFGSTLIELKFIDENVLAAFLSKQIDIPCISLLHIDIPKKVARKMSRQLALDCKAVPVRIDENARLEIAMVDPTDLDTLAKLEKAVSMIVAPLIAPESSIQTMINKLYPDALAAAEDTLSGKTQATQAPNPMFMDLIEEIEETDLDHRLVKIERNLEQIWVLLEKMLRTLESREEAKRSGR
ncbi:MAG TPA: hypothetical protein VLV78_03670 [Thermoanaerobaculia bacterium]|nr:hypothetical protein [Thermoanaerobaculia bacterium]